MAHPVRLVTSNPNLGEPIFMRSGTSPNLSPVGSPVSSPAEIPWRNMTLPPSHPQQREPVHQTASQPVSIPQSHPAPSLHNTTSPPPAPGSHVPVPLHSDLDKIGWRGGISRQVAEDVLVCNPVGTYLVRWSSNTNSYVLSVHKAGGIQHISGIISEQVSGKVSVTKENGTVSVFANMESYINKMAALGVITYPLRDVQEVVYHSGDLYL
eukprot:TRINITY_DN10178_c0_g1_i2.p1 TRINITY_DN10178_c0_g1~~TRINITY_DN10178_c0_g1_i2.p1  ORF type:complete len:210 (+),score=45.89 TRINITY_DN10178_c0_g1_i2:235-864(+)